MPAARAGQARRCAGVGSPMCVGQPQPNRLWQNRQRRRGGRRLIQRFQKRKGIHCHRAIVVIPCRVGAPGHVKAQGLSTPGLASQQRYVTDARLRFPGRVWYYHPLPFPLAEMHLSWRSRCSVRPAAPRTILADSQEGKTVTCRKCEQKFTVKPPRPKKKADDDDRDSRTERGPRRSRVRDEEEDDRPRRRRARDEDEDDEDDRQRRRVAKKSSGGGTVLIVLGSIAAVLLLMCGGGGLLFYFVIKDAIEEEQAQMPAGPGPAPAPFGGGKPIPPPVPPPPPQ